MIGSCFLTPRSKNSIFARDNVRTRSLWASSHGRKGIEPTRISVSEGRLSDTGHDVNLRSAQDKAGHLFFSSSCLIPTAGIACMLPAKPTPKGYGGLCLSTKSAKGCVLAFEAVGKRSIDHGKVPWPTRGLRAAEIGRAHV